MKPFDKRYIGDGAYIACDGWSLIFTAENGIRATDTVAIDVGDVPALLEALRCAGVIPPVGTYTPGEVEGDMERDRR